jgi:hypothetical protein
MPEEPLRKPNSQPRHASEADLCPLLRRPRKPADSDSRTRNRPGAIDVQHQSIQDPEAGGSYTVKRYESDKVADGKGGWKHKVIRLLSENPDFEPIVLTGIDEGEVSVLAELVEVLPSSGRCVVDE